MDPPPAKKSRPQHSVTWQLSSTSDWKDTQPVSMTLDESLITTIGDESWVPVHEILKQLGTAKYDCANVAAILIGDRLPLRYYLNVCDPNLMLTPSKFYVWAIPAATMGDPKIHNWFPTNFADVAPAQGDAHFAPTLSLLQPAQRYVYTHIKGSFKANELGRFIAKRTIDGTQHQRLAQLRTQKLVGVIWDYSPTIWNPGIRMASSFGRFLTVSHEYVSRHPQCCVRILLHQDLMVPADVELANGLAIGEHISFDTQADESDDPLDLVVSPALRAMFQTQRRWIVEGTRRNLDLFCTKYMGCLDNAVFRLVNSGYAQYLVPKIPPSDIF